MEKRTDPQLNAEQGNATWDDESWTRIRGTHRLWAFVKNAHTMGVYWEVGRIQKQLIVRHFMTQWEDLNFYLQVYDVTDIDFDGYNSHTLKHIPVHREQDSWFIADLTAKRTYLVDYGTKTKAGHFFTILRSNLISLPPTPQRHKVSPFVKFDVPEALRHPPENCANTKEKKPVDEWPPFGSDGYGLAHPFPIGHEKVGHGND